MSHASEPNGLDRTYVTLPEAVQHHEADVVGVVGSPATVLLTEDSAALRFLALYRDRLRYCHSTGAWFEWDGSLWRQNNTKGAYHFARELARKLSHSQDEKIRSNAQSTKFAAGVERFAQADPAFAVTAAAWDRDPLLLGTPAGTVDLRTGELRYADPADAITKTTAVAPAAQPCCSHWLRFLDEVTGGDQGLVRFLQQWLGYCLTGLTSAHALVFIYGPGGNGKTVLLNVVAGLLGTYAVTAAMDTFTAGAEGRHPTDLAMLRGARLVTASETEEGRAWAESRVKQMTGGDPITARFMRRDFFTYTPQFKLMVVGNHKPVLRSGGEAMRRRLTMIPFTHVPPAPDHQLEGKLRAEWPGILRWLVEGCLDWQQNGLLRPASIIEASEAYIAEQDVFGQWLAEECDLDPENPNEWERSQSLYQAWKAYAHQVGEEPGSMKVFAARLCGRGPQPRRTSSARGFTGIRLKVLPGGMTRDGR